jgi:hypothetical protein
VSKCPRQESNMGARFRKALLRASRTLHFASYLPSYRGRVTRSRAERPHR